MANLSELHRRCGSLGLAALAFLLIGIICFTYALANRGGISTSCDRYLAEKPNGKWVRLDGCVLSRIESIAKTSAGKSATEVYIPVRPTMENGRANTHILLASTAQGDLDFVNQANGPQSQRANRNVFIANFGNKIEENRAIEGRIVRSSQVNDRERAKLMKTLPTLAPDFVIVEERERPGFALPVTLLLVGSTLGGIRLFPLWKRKLRTSPQYSSGELFATK